MKLSLNMEMDEHTLEEKVRMLSEMAERESCTPLGLYKCLRDIEDHPQLYGTDLDRERIYERIFNGSPLQPTEVTRLLCSIASHWHRKEMREMVRRWQEEADELDVPVMYVLEGQEDFLMP